MVALLGDVDLCLVDALAVPASVHGLDGYIVAVNELAVRASGRSRAELMSAHFTDPLTPETKPLVEAQFRRVVEQNVPVELQTAFVDGSGRRRAVRALYVPLSSGDEVVAVLIMAFEAMESPRDSREFRGEPEISARQREILELLASGLSTNEIAERLSIAPATVRNHLRNLLRSLDAHSRVEAIVAAQRIGLLSGRPLAPAED
jgi:PAS domain S-box-containing protein